MPKYKKNKILKPWMRIRGYRHFDQTTSRNRLSSFSQDHVAIHGFFPFIGKCKVSRRYDRGVHKVKRKLRDLKYASHFDAAVYAYYTHLLSILYEEEIAELAIGENVIAYRKLPGSPCNIHHANVVFDEIMSIGNCHVISTDVKDFFDSLQHALLKRQWLTLLNEDKLPQDHFAVFKSITQYRWVELPRIQAALGVSKNSLSTKSKAGKARRPLGTLEQIRTVLKRTSLVNSNLSDKGIPQGSPISALLSNIYMMDVDRSLAAYAQNIGGIYRRYSDDILLAVPQPEASRASETLTRELQSVGLSPHPSKTLLVNFSMQNGDLVADQPLQYLGFEFDGRVVRLRNRTVSLFYQRMSRAIRRAERAAASKNSNKLRRTKLYELFSHKGRRNFITYALRASDIIYPNHVGRSPIKKQIAAHWRKLHEGIARAEERLSNRLKSE